MVERKLILQQPLHYEVKVSGYLDESWIEWIGENTTVDRAQNDGLFVSTIYGTFDQAALHGLLRRLYSFGFPLISVIYIK